MSVTFRAAAALIDMDGTLVDSTAVVERIWGDWAAEHGLDLDHVLSVIHGRQGQESMARLLPDRPVEQNLTENRRILERETTETEGIVEIAGAAELLAALAGLPHALVTSATRALAEARMTAAGLAVPDVAVTAESVSASKPDPEGFLLGAKSLGAPAADCVVFEDSAAGIAAGRSAGMRVIGIGSNALDHGADWVVPDLTAVRVAGAASGIEISLTPLA